MFKFLKKIFEKEVEKEEVSLDDLSGWFAERTKGKKESVNSALKADFDEMREVFSSFRENIGKLEEAEMKDEDRIQSKIKNIVLGHRASYARALLHFLDLTDIPVDTDYRDAIAFVSSLEKRMDELSRTTMKSYYAVQHLFHTELEAVTKNLKQLAALIKQVKDKVSQSKIKEIDHIKRKIKRLQEAIVHKEKAALDLEAKKKVLRELEDTRGEIGEKIEGIKKGEDSAALTTLKQELQEITESIVRLENKIIQLFSPLEAGLKKYSRVAFGNEELIERYVASSLKALFYDQELKIIEILEKMKASIATGGIDLKDQKKKRTLEAMEEITAKGLTTLILGYNELRGKKEEVEKQIMINPTQSLIKEQEHQLENISFTIEQTQKEVGFAEKSEKELDPASLKRDIEDKIKELFAISFAISS